MFLQMCAARRFATGLLVALAAMSFGLWSGAAHAQQLDLLALFSGSLTGSGEFRGLDGSVRRIQGTRLGVASGNSVVVTENLVFSDGEKSTTIWTFTRSGSAGYVATRKEVAGPVTVSVNGNRFRMSYQATVKSKDGATHTLGFDETYTRTGSGTISNATQVSMFIIPLGSSTMTWTRAGG